MKLVFDKNSSFAEINLTSFPLMIQSNNNQDPWIIIVETLKYNCGKQFNFKGKTPKIK